jgi:hypothetical protein
MAAVSPATSEQLPLMIVHKDPSCGCCTGWVSHVKAAGFPVKVKDTPDLNRVKARLAIPRDLAACHTAEVGDYIVEGHVPASAIRRLLAEKPSARGLAVPGMPVGSPGMEVEGSEPEVYDVILFGPSDRGAFGRFKGHQPI